MKKTFRCFIDFKAEDKDDALEQLNIHTADKMLNGFRIQEDPFDDEEEATILEIARRALADADMFDELATELDLSDDVMKKLQDKIHNVTERV